MGHETTESVDSRDAEFRTADHVDQQVGGEVKEVQLAEVELEWTEPLKFSEWSGAQDLSHRVTVER